MENLPPRDPIRFTPGESAADSRSRERPISSMVREIADSFKSIVQSEIHLAKAEARHTVNHVKSHSLFVVVSGIVALAGILPLMAFLVIGLGHLLGDRFWLSSLIIGVLMVGVGGLLAARYARMLREEDLSMPHMRENIRDEGQIVSRKLQEVSRVAGNRRSA